MNRHDPTASPGLSLTMQVGLLAGPFLTMMDSNVVNVALPTIATQLGVGLESAQWVLSGYLLALAASLAGTAYLAKRFGTRRVYLLSMLGFTLTSALCAAAPSIGVLIALRTAQGVLGAPLVPLAMSMLLGPGDERANFPPAAGVVLFLAPAIGPTVGGLLIHVGGWPLIFLINVPFGLIGTLGTLRLPARFAGDADRGVRFDLLGMLMLAGGMVLAIYGSTLGPRQGWGSPHVWPLLAAGGVLLALYTVWALVRRHPAVDLKLLRHRQSALSILLSLVTSIVMFAMLFLVPVYMEELQGLTPLVAGLALLPQGLVTGLGTVLGDRLGLRWGVRRSALLGLLILTGCTALLLTLDLTTPAWMTALILSGRGLALGLTVQPLLLGMIGGLSRDAIHDGNTLFNVVERVGGSVGIALLATFFTIREQARIAATLASLGLPSGDQGTGALAQLPAAMRAALAHAAVAGLHDTILLLVGLSALGCGISLLLRNVRGAIEKDATAASTSALAPAGLAAE